jgi:hypothetical protein
MCVRTARSARYVDFGQYEGTERADASPWNTDEELNLLLADAGQTRDVCGVLVLGARAAFTGAYSYLHRDVPLLYRHQACDASKVANYLIAESANQNVPRAYQVVRSRGQFSLFRRVGGCTPPPAEHDHMLEGADDMGLGRTPIRQPDRRELSIAAGSSAAAFVRGFSHGEHLECRNVRWALGRSSEMAFSLQPTGSAYTLSFTAQPYFRARPQTVSVKLNGGLLATYAMSEGWDGYQADVRPALLKRGRNLLTFEFAKATRAEGDDRRELAVLFERLSLTPMAETTEIDVGTAPARVHLRDGFSVDETGGERTFAWSTGATSQISLTLAGGPRFRAFRISAHAFDPIAPVDVDVAINHMPAGRIRVPGRWIEASVAIPRQGVHLGLNSVELSYSRTARPRDMDPASLDDRDLAVMVDRIVVDTLEPRMRIDAGAPGARPYLLSGFSSDEKEPDRFAVWSDGPISTFAFPLVDGLDAPYKLGFVVQGFPPTMPQEVSVIVNDRRIGQLTPTGAWRREHVAVPPSTLVSGVNLVQLRYPRTARPRDTLPNNTDSRELALRFDVVDLAPSESDIPEIPSP